MAGRTEAFIELSKIIKERRAIYPGNYTDEPIEDKLIWQILENANWAPTHKKTEPWRFKVLKSVESKDQLADFLLDQYRKRTPEEDRSEFKMKKMRRKAINSACIIAICMKRDPKESLPEWEEEAAVAAAVQNMWLSCTSLGIGCYWSSPSTIKHMQDLLQLEEGEKCMGLFYMGYMKAGEYKSERGEIQNKVKWL